MIETILSKIGTEGIIGAIAALWTVWRGRKARKVLSQWKALMHSVEAARSETSPGGRDFTQSEMEDLVVKTLGLLQSLTPIFGRIFFKKK